jgi:hypothetical protein
MIRSIDYQRLSALVARRSAGDYVESAIAQKRRRPSGKTSRRRGIQHFDLDANSGRGKPLGLRSIPPRDLSEAGPLETPDTIDRCPADHESEDDPAADLHRKLFHNATVSGKM